MTSHADDAFLPEGKVGAEAWTADEASADEASADEASADEASADEAAAVVDTRPGELTETQLEALLFVAERPLSRSEIAQLAGVGRETVDACIGDLHVTLGERGIRLVELGEHVELATAPEAGRLIARYVGVDAPRLSTASLETLAIVAYRQPCTRATIERIRGVDSDYTLRTLMHRRLVAELGRSEAPGRPTLFGTGFDFLERFGLTSLDQLPPLEPEIAERLFSTAADESGAAQQDGFGLAGESA
jgi:segregation and condensation protein B